MAARRGRDERGHLYHSVLRAPAEGEAELICKQDGVIAGLPVFARVYELLGGGARPSF